jgi:hypothetical protein
MRPPTRGRRRRPPPTRLNRNRSSVAGRRLRSKLGSRRRLYGSLSGRARYRRPRVAYRRRR